MKLMQDNYSYESLLNNCDKISGGNKRLQIITILFNPENNEEIIKIFKDNGFSVDNKNFGGVIELSKKYYLYKDLREVFYYLIRHPEYPEIYFLFTFNTIMDIYTTLFGRINSIPEIYHLWLPPRYFDKLRNAILKIEGSYITYFHGKKIDIGKQECKRPRFSRDIKYKGDDAKLSSEELRFEYGVLPQAIEFVIPSKLNFKVNKNGYYTLIAGNTREFIDTIINKFINLVMRDNKEIEKAKYEIKKEKGIEILESEEVFFEIEKEIAFEEFEEFLKIMEGEGFSPYNKTLRKGSVIFSSNIVDEKKGNIFSLTSNGKQFTVIPKYRSSFVSIVRFYRFLIEKIDQMAKVVYENEKSKID